MKTFVTADHHFYDAKSIRHHSRPFKSLHHMHEVMVELWNHIVGPNDQVFHLGDLMIRATKRKAEILARLNGKKFLVPGNHDCRNAQQREAVAEHFTIIDKIHEDLDFRVVLCHYPLMTWRRFHDEDFVNLHGHSHGRLEFSRRRLDVGVDMTRYAPIPIMQAIELARMWPNQREKFPRYGRTTAQQARVSITPA